ncbi:hypothetical protein TNCV_4315761 [Trichonephila clavipes]|nr:hypothetical protein TNCV_4315761 [Trichonephila clavipes]
MTFSISQLQNRFPYTDGITPTMSTCEHLNYYRVLSSDIAPTMDGCEKTTLSASRNPECNSRCKKRPLPHQQIGKVVILKHWKERLCLPPLSQITFCEMEIVISLNNL